MNDLSERRLRDSTSSSSSSGGESPSFGHPGFGALQHSEFNNGTTKRKHDDSELQLDAFEKPPKKVDLETAEKAQRMMAMMGYKKGVGLGKHGQGRLEPVQASQQKGRRGLGHHNTQLQKAILRWNPDDEVVTIEDDIMWLTTGQQPPTIEELSDWMRVGPTKRTIEDETLYCNPEIVTGVASAKSVFDNLDQNEMRRARTRSNPFETIRGSIFLNRAAVKTAEIDRACNYMFTAPKILRNNELLYFADVCAGPGGFSEYVLWRKKWRCKGFGFTLKDSNDFKLDDFYAGPPDTFHPYYGPNGDGDVYNPENQVAFRNLIMKQTNGKGVHFMMSDGGFSVEGQENIQEILSKQLYLCQCLVALMVVRTEGHFVTKLFDVFTPFSAGLVYLMSRCFKSVTIYKPKTSRPANSERYLICKGKLANVDSVIAYLSSANRVLLNQDKNRDVMQLVPHHVIAEDQEFFNYLKNSNDKLGKNQIVGLLKIAAFCEDTTLVEIRQAEIRKKCLEYWGLPDTSRTMPRTGAPGERLNTIMKNASTEFMKTKPTLLKTSNVEDLVNTHNDWFFMLCGSSARSLEDSATFYIGTGGSKCFRYDNGTWIREHDLYLAADTLVFAEMILELRGEHMRQRKTKALHILDAYFLGGEDISRKCIEERHALIKLYAEALWRPTNGDWTRVRVKELHPLTHDVEDRMNLELRTLKKGGPALTHAPSRQRTHYEDANDPYFIVPKSIVFMKRTAQNWSRHVSRSTGYPYYFNSKTNDKFYDRDRPRKANASLPETYETRKLWTWPPDPALTRDCFFEMIRSKSVRPVNS